MTIETVITRISPEEIDRNVGREAFNALEEYMQGSTAPKEGLQEPLKPWGIIRGLSVKKVNRLRSQQAWFSTFMAYEMDGLIGLYQVPLFSMTEVDSAGVSKGYPKLYGIWDRRTQEIDRSEELLAAHELTREKIEEILETIKGSR